MDTWACGYADNSVEGFTSPFICNVKAGCKRWHDFHLRKNPDYKDISYNSNKKMFNLNLPKNLEVSHLSGEGAGHALGIWICGCSLFYKREFWASKSAGAHSTKSLKISGCKR